MGASRMRRTLAVTLCCLLGVGLTAPVADAAAPSPAAPPDQSRVDSPNATLGPGWQNSSDRAVTTVGDDEGLNVLVADAAAGYQWRTAARLSEPGFDSDQWIGQSCVTASGNRAVVTYAPRTFTNSETASDEGAFAAVVDLRSGAVTKLPMRVSLAYYNPGCGEGEDVALSTLDSSAKGMSTSVSVVDAARGRVARTVTAAGQLTSAVPFEGDVVAALGDHLVSLDAKGGVKTLSSEPGVPFRLHPDSRGGLTFEVPVGSSAHVRRFAGGKSTLLGVGSLTGVQVAGSAGQAFLLGPDAARIHADGSGVRSLAAPTDAEPSSSGALVVTGSTAHAGQARIDVKAQVVATNRPVAFSITPEPLQAAQGMAASPALNAMAGGRAAPMAAAATDPSTVPWDPDRGCAVPRNDPTIQTFQATAHQVEWAADLAVQGKLTVQRPVNWEGSGIPVAWTPQGMFPPRPLSGGGTVPAQVLLGVLAQESNTMQASPHAVDSTTGNTNQGGFYGNGVSWSTVDCGYGVGQVTTGMAASTPAGTPVADGNMAYTTAEQQQAIATDYASNIAASLNLLVDKWNALKAAGILANGGDPTYIENWWFALWAYNSGIQPDANHGNTTGCTPGPNCTDGAGNWGLGWFNNPANPRLPADRGVFSNAPVNTKVPNHWTYPELVIGWSGSPVARFDYVANQWGTAYQAANWLNETVRVPPYNQFCAAVNSCTPNGAPDLNGAMAAGLCAAKNSDCWWHQPVTWLQCTDAGFPCGAQAITYAAGTAEPSGADPYPADCSTSSLPASAVIVDDVTTPSAVSCGKTWTDKGNFSLHFPQSSFSGCTTNCELYQGKIDFHQLGAGFGGHVWFTHTVPPAVDDNGNVINKAVTGTWTPPASTTGWTRVKVHIPAGGGGNTAQADYTIQLGNGQTRHRLVNQHWNKNTWVDLGTFNLSAGASVSLSNVNAHVPPQEVDGSDIAFDAMAFIPSVKPTVDYVAIGDSYSAGQGGEPYNPDSDNSTDGCHRATQAYPYQVHLPGSTQTIAAQAGANGAADFAFLACSGAVTTQLTSAAVGAPTLVNTPWSATNSFDSHEPYQIDDSGWLDQDTTLVTLTLGGDDARFAAVLKGCIMTISDCTASGFRLTVNGTVDPQPLTSYEPTVIADLRYHLADVYRQIHQLAPNAKIVVLGYPKLLSAVSGNLVCAQFLNNDIDFLNQMADDLNTATGAAVSDVANADGTMRITYVDAIPGFAGHDACQLSSFAWINAVIATSSSGSGSQQPGAGTFHPTLTGQQEYAALANGAL